MAKTKREKCPMCGRKQPVHKGGVMHDHVRFPDGAVPCEGGGVRFDDAAFIARAPLLKAAHDAAMERDRVRKAMDQAHATFAAHSRNLPAFQAQATAAEVALDAYDAAHPRAV